MNVVDIILYVETEKNGKSSRKKEKIGRKNNTDEDDRRMWNRNPCRNISMKSEVVGGRET